MPGSTPIYNLPYPVPTDLVINGPATIQQLAEDVETTIDSVASGAVPTSRSITAGSGLSGGGALTSNVTLSANFGTIAGTVAQGNDTRIVNSVQNTRQVLAGQGLTGGGALSGDVTLGANFGTTAGTIAEGNDSRIVSAVQPTRQVLPGTGMTGGGSLASDVTLSVDAPVLAQNPEFSTRYKAINDDIFIPAASLNFDTGTRVIVNDATDVIEMAESVDSYVVGTVAIPAQWQEAALSVVWANEDTGTGDVQWDFFANGTTVGSNVSTVSSLTPSSIATAGSRYLLTITGGPDFPVGQFVRFKIQRTGTSGSDTLANPVYLVGVIVSRFS